MSWDPALNQYKHQHVGYLHSIALECNKSRFKES